jgi:hypothetical protein
MLFLYFFARGALFEKTAPPGPPRKNFYISTFVAKTKLPSCRVLLSKTAVLWYTSHTMKVVK